jgi:fibronectin-binding autotransporter adhesin
MTSKLATTIAIGAVVFAATLPSVRAIDIVTFWETSENGDFTAGNWDFFYSGVGEFGAVLANNAGGVQGGTQQFHWISYLAAAAENSVTGGYQTFFDSSYMDITAANAVGPNAYLTFNDTSYLNISVANGLQSSAQLWFAGSSQLNASVAGSINGGEISVIQNAALNASAGAITAGQLGFEDSAVLNANGAGAFTSGAAEFTSTSILNANASESVSGGYQEFDQYGQLFANVSNAVSGGMQVFSGYSAFQVVASSGLNGGTQKFTGYSLLNASWANAVTGGEQVFEDSSAMNVSVASSLAGGEQSFKDESTMIITVTGGVTGGTQYFSGSSQVLTDVSQGITGGTQNFTDSSVFNADVYNAIGGGTQVFDGNSSLIASVTGAMVYGGEQFFYGNSTLQANVYGSVDGAKITFAGNSIFSINTQNALGDGSNLNFIDNSTLQLNGNVTTLSSVAYFGKDTTIRNASSAGFAVSPTLLTITGTAPTVIEGNIIDGAAFSSLAILKTGTNALALSGSNSYSGGTTIGQGLVIGVSDTAFGTGAITIEAGAALASGAPDLRFQNIVNLAGRISPGVEGVQPIAQLTIGGGTWAGGATYAWDINDATGIAGDSWDLLTVDGAILFTSSPLDPFVIEVSSLSGANSGDAANFDANGNYSWLIAQSSGGFAGLQDGYRIDTANFENAISPIATWSLTAEGENLYLNYQGSVIPEPSTLGLALVSLAAAALRRRRAGR